MLILLHYFSKLYGGEAVVFSFLENLLKYFCGIRWLRNNLKSLIFFQLFKSLFSG